MGPKDGSVNLIKKFKIKMNNLKLNELKKFYQLAKINETSVYAPYGAKENLSFLTKKNSFPMVENPMKEENNKQTKGSIVLYRLNKLVKSTHRRRLAKSIENLTLINETNNPSPLYVGEVKSNESANIKLLSKGENTTLELLKISEIKKESLLNKTGILNLFSYNSKDKNKKNTIIYQYLNNNLQKINPIPDINTQQNKGLLFNYNKTIAYNFLNTSIKLGKLPIREPNSSKISSLSISLSSQCTEANTINRSYEGIDINKDLFKINKLLFYFFKSLNCLISKPVYLHTPDKVIIELFYFLNIPQKKVFRLFSILYYNSFRKKWLSKKSQILSLSNRKNSLRNKGIAKTPFIKRKIRKAISRLRGKSNLQRSLLFNLRKFNLAEVFINKFQIIIEILTRKFKKPVVFHITRLHYPYFDSNILANLLSLNIRNKKKKSRIAINKIYSNKAIKNLNDHNLKSVNFIPAFISGLILKIGGRLMKEPIIPRLTTKKFERGATSPGKVNYLDIANITKKNKKGANTITIKAAQNFFK